METIFGKRLRQAMEKQRYSVTDLVTYCEPLFKAEGYSLCKQDIYKYLGSGVVPTFGRLSLLAKVLDVEIWWLLGAPEETHISDEEMKLINAWRKATISEKENVAFMLRNYGMELNPPQEIRKKEA